MKHQPEVRRADWGIPTSSNFPSERFPTAISRSPAGVNFNGSLVVYHGCERQAVSQRYRRIAFDDFGKQATAGFQAQAERQYIEQHNVLMSPVKTPP